MSLWSPQQVVQTAINSGLPGGKGISAIISSSLALTVCYAFLIIALLLLTFFPSQKYVARIAVAGAVCSILSLRDGRSLRHLFYGYFGFQSRVEYGDLVGVLFAVMVALLLISVGDKSPRALIDKVKGEEKAHSCVIACVC